MAFFQLKVYLPLFAGIVLLSGLGVTVLVLQQQQETRSRASFEEQSEPMPPNIDDNKINLDPKQRDTVSTLGSCGTAGCCSSKGGKCQYTSNSCSGSYISNYCGGGSNYKCCVPKTSSTGTSTTLNLNSVFLHGIGKAGDSIKPGEAGGGNPDPDHKERNVTVDIRGSVNIIGKKGTLVFDSGSGSFATGSPIDLGSNFVGGTYDIFVKMDVSKPVKITKTITKNTTNQIEVGALVTGDIKNDGKLDAIDYNILLGCFSDILPPASCDATKKLQADISDDGEVNHPDLNLFIRELTTNL